MICESKNVRVVKLSNTKFYCCSGFELDYKINEYQPISMQQYCDIETIKYCKHCGHKVSSL